MTRRARIAGLGAVGIVGALAMWLTMPAAAVQQGASLTGQASTSRGDIHGQGSATSTNWAGYAATGTTFTDVTGTWTEPPVSCTGQQQYAAFWVGLDGFTTGGSSQVEQVGTDSDCTPGKKKGGPSYYAWFDLYPAVFHEFPAHSCTVSPGDTVTGEVSSSGGQFTLRISDVTQGWSCSAEQSTQAPGSSAEWVVEDVFAKGSGKLTKISNFGTVDFSGATANGSAISSFQNTQITMQVKHLVKVSTSPLGPDGSSFSLTWRHS